MPRLSQWFVRATFVYLLLGFTIGWLLLAHKGQPLYSGMWSWLPTHIEFLLMGWVVQLTMGMAFWILPRYWQSPKRPKEGFAYLAFVLLNVGIVLVVAGTTFGANHWFLVIGRVAEVAAMAFFARHAWTRIVSRDGV